MRKLLFINIITIFSITSSCTGFEYITGSNEPGLVDGTLIQAKFNYPTKMTTDEKGNLYVLDQNNLLDRSDDINLIRKISTDNKVSVFFKSEILKGYDNGYYIGDIEINGNYLFFSTNKGSVIKKINLDNPKEISIVIGKEFENAERTDEYIERPDTTIQNTKFVWIVDFTFDKDSNIIALDGNLLKKINFKDNIVKKINFDIDKDISYNFTGNTETLNINPKTNNLYFKKEDMSGQRIYILNEKNQVSLSKSSYFLSKTFDFDLEGNIYFVDTDEKLKKISIDGKEEILSSTWGIVNKVEHSNKNIIPTMNNNNIHIDRKRNILYLSTDDNKIYKFNLKR